MSWDAAAIWLEVISFFLVTLDLWGEERLLAVQSRINLIQHDAVARKLNGYTDTIDNAIEFFKRYIVPAIQIVLIGGIALGVILNVSDKTFLRSFAFPFSYVLTAIIILVAIAFFSRIILVCTKMIVLVGLFVLKLAPVQGVMLTVGSMLFMASKAISLANLP